MELRFPDHEMLPSYIAALERGWVPSASVANSREMELQRIADDADAFLADQVDMDGTGPPIEEPDGSTVKRIPGFKKWIWDGEYCGGISFRWQPMPPGEFPEELPAHVLGHIGYGVVDWKRRQGYASRALKMTLAEGTARGFRYVEITCDEDNIGSRRVIESAGGLLHERFTMPDWRGGHPGLRFRVPLGGDL